MARTIQVTPEDLENTAKTIRYLADQYQSKYTSLYQKTDDMGQTWKGTDNTAFVTQIGEFKGDLGKMYGLMYEYADFLDKSASAYRTTQKNVKDQAEKLTNRSN